jgi:uncharacterized protein (DUF58 family)
VGSSVAGSRPYRPGDNPAAIDWKASARVSSVRAEPEFIVREHFADESPRIVVVADRRPSMALYPEPWLDKPAALRAVWRLAAAAALAELGLVGYLDSDEEAQPAWFPPSAGHGLERVDEHLAQASFRGPDDSLDEDFRYLVGVRRSLPPGSFVFVCSDYLSAPAREWWARGLAYRWDVVPVVIQDPVWEQSFPLLDSLIVSFADPATGRTHNVRLRRGESEIRRGQNEARLALLLAEFRALGLEPIVIDSAAESDVLRALTAWGETRLAVRKGAL